MSFFLTNFCSLSKTKRVLKTSLSTTEQSGLKQVLYTACYMVAVVAQSAICEIAN